jgi:hypothetical protein
MGSGRDWQELFRSPEVSAGPLDWDMFVFQKESSNGQDPDHGTPVVPGE